MAGRRVLALVLDEGHETSLRAAIEAREDGPLAVHVVAPAHVGALDWLATAEDDARAEASARALSTEWSLADAADVEGEAGESDPVQAVEDALRTFAADEILVVGAADRNGGLEHSLDRFGLPVTWLRDGLPLRERSPSREALRDVTSGRSKTTPFVAFVVANLALFVFGALASLVALLAFWLS
jgi:hypothetical protein